MRGFAAWLAVDCSWEALGFCEQSHWSLGDCWALSSVITLSHLCEGLRSTFRRLECQQPRCMTAKVCVERGWSRLCITSPSHRQDKTGRWGEMVKYARNYCYYYSMYNENKHRGSKHPKSILLQQAVNNDSCAFRHCVHTSSNMAAWGLTSRDASTESCACCNLKDEKVIVALTRPNAVVIE